MRNKIQALLFCVLMGMGIALIVCRVDSSNKSGYIPGGKNIEAFEYGHSEGYPPFPEKAKFLGNLEGNWYDMGRQLGEKAGEDTRFVSDIWWNDECELWGKAETLKAFALYEAQIAAFQPGLIDFMKGIAEGASGWLSGSVHVTGKNAATPGLEIS